MEQPQPDETESIDARARRQSRLGISMADWDGESLERHVLMEQPEGYVPYGCEASPVTGLVMEKCKANPALSDLEPEEQERLISEHRDRVVREMESAKASCEAVNDPSSREPADDYEIAPGVLWGDLVVVNCKGCEITLCSRRSEHLRMLPDLTDRAREHFPPRVCTVLESGGYLCTTCSHGNRRQ